MERANLSRLNGWTFPVTATAARPLGTGRALNQIPLSGPGPLAQRTDYHSLYEI